MFAGQPQEPAAADADADADCEQHNVLERQRQEVVLDLFCCTLKQGQVRMLQHHACGDASTVELLNRDLIKSGLSSIRCMTRTNQHITTNTTSCFIMVCGNIPLCCPD